MGELLGVGCHLQEVVDLIEDLGVEGEEAVLDEGSHGLWRGPGFVEVLDELIDGGYIIGEELIEIACHVFFALLDSYVLGVGKRHQVSVEFIESLYFLGLVEVERGKRLLLPLFHLLDHLDVAVACLGYLRVIPHQIACSDLISAEQQRPLNILTILHKPIDILGQRRSTDHPQLISPVAVPLHILLEILNLPLPIHLEFHLKLIQVDLILLPRDPKIYPQVLGIELILAGEDRVEILLQVVVGS